MPLTSMLKPGVSVGNTIIDKSQPRLFEIVAPHLQRRLETTIGEFRGLGNWNRVLGGGTKKY